MKRAVARHAIADLCTHHAAAGILRKKSLPPMFTQTSLIAILALGMSATSYGANAKSAVVAAGFASGDQIVVNARKRAERVQDVPISITAFSGETLEEKGVVRFKDALNYIPNVSISDGSGANSASNIVIRGITSNTRNAGFESGVSVYVDGFFTGRAATFNQNLVGIQSLEVLRGPQGTLFGKNTIAGAINITTRKPDTEVFSARARIEAGNQEYFHGDVSVNIPLVKDRSALLLSGFGTTRDGYVENLFNGDKFRDDEIYGARAQLRLSPTDEFTADLSLFFTKEDHAQNFPEVLDGTAAPKDAIGGGLIILENRAPGPNTVEVDFSPFEKIESKGAVINLEWQPSFGGTVTSISGWSRTNVNIANDNDNSEIDSIIANFLTDTNHYSQELRYASENQTLVDYVAGVYLFGQEAEQSIFGIFGSDLFIPPLANTFVNPNAKVDTFSVALFGDAQIHLNDRLDLLVGLRYTHEEKDLAFSQVSTLPVFPEFALFEDSFSDDAFSPTGGLAYIVNDSVNLYAKVSRGYKSGGWNADILPGSADPEFDPSLNPASIRFSPEFVTNYETGAKFTAADGRFNGNLAVFFMDYKDLQVSQFLGLAGGTVISNAGQAEIIGVEFDFEANLLDNFTLAGSIGYNDAEFVSFESCGPAEDCTGNKLQSAPSWSASVGAVYEHELGGWGAATLRADYSYRSSFYFTPQNLDRLQSGEQNSLDASLTFRPDEERWSIGLWGKNLTDETYIIGGQDDPLINQFGAERSLVGYNRPRSWGGRVTVSY